MNDMIRTENLSKTFRSTSAVEPFSGLDPLVRDEIIEGLLERTPETTIFLSSHDLVEIESFRKPRRLSGARPDALLRRGVGSLRPLPRDNHHAECAIGCAQEHSAHVAAGRGRD